MRTLIGASEPNLEEQPFPTNWQKEVADETCPRIASRCNVQGQDAFRRVLSFVALTIPPEL